MIVRRLLELDDGTLAGNAAVFDELAHGRLDGLVPGDPEAAAFWAQVAAEFAWRNHPGSFASPELEHILTTASRVPVGDPGAGAGRRAPRSRDHASRERVLHVLTTAYPIGGHTRLAWRWIRADGGRQSSVVLTRQGRHPVPRELRSSVARAGGTLTELGPVHGLAARAAALRRAMARADLVVLHVHPSDGLPLLAAAGWPDRPPTLFANHADHVFWLGHAATDLLVCLRGSGARLAVARRGVPGARLTVQPVPIVMPRPATRREAVRATLGLRADDVVALSVANDYKFAHRPGADYLETVTELVGRLPRLTVLVVGPAAVGRWAAAEAATGGRIRALGLRRDIAALFGAADLYLDSFPFASLTSLLEAGSHGLPLVAFRSHPRESEVLGGDGPGLDESILATDDLVEYRETVTTLVRDATARRALGERTRQAIEGAAAGLGWQRRLEESYVTATALRAAASGPLTSVEPVEAGPGDLDERLAQLRDRPGLATAIGALLPSAGASTRLAIGRALWRAGVTPPVGAVLPDSGRAPLRRVEPLWRAAIAVSRKLR